MPINEEMGVEEFVKRIKDAIDLNPENRYLFFIGAGCSISSNIPGSAELTRKWLKELKNILTPDEYSKWYKDNIGLSDVPNIAKFYSVVIKKRFPIKAQRQQEMEKLIDNGSESFGYIVLANLLASKKYGKNFNIVFTTNFDNLIAESIYRHTSEKVRLISHDSLMSFVNPNSARSQIVKLHGDVELEPKNTEDETSKLNDESLDIVKHTLTNCGLIFVGYGGNDKSIINSLNQIGKDSITNGIFWIRNTLPESKLKDWLDSREHSYWIKHSNFDHLMLYFLNHFDIPRPDKQRCLDAETDFRKSLDNFNKQIEDIDSPKKDQFREILRKYVSSIDDWISLSVEADGLSKSDYPKAVGLYEEGIKKFDNNPNLLGSFGNFYANNEKYDEAIKYYDEALRIKPDHVEILNNKGVALGELGKHDEAIKCYDEVLRIKPDDVDALYNKSCTYSLMNKIDLAFEFLEKSIHIDSKYKEMAKTDSDFDNIKNNELFLKLIN